MSSASKSHNRDLIAAFDLLYEVAMNGRLIAEGHDMLHQEAAQLEAISQVHDFLANHHEEIEDRFGADPEMAEGAMLPELDLSALREVRIDHPLNDSMLITVELAARQCLEGDETPGLSDALDLVGAFWMRRGSGICDEVLSIPMPEDPS